MSLMGTISLYAAPNVAFAISDNVQVAVATGIIAGIFALANTLLTAKLAKAAIRIEQRQDRALQLIGERSSDKPITQSGRNGISETSTEIVKRRSDDSFRGNE